ncbi:MAG: aquaporin [Cytophagales bacterium]|nr:aquaporin [Cytophagales bacterium]
MPKSPENAFNSQSLFAALAEGVGTFFLALVALTVPAPVTPYAVGLTLLVFVYAIGGLSGCHINPAVTVGLVASRRFPLIEGLMYIVLQIAGALLARFVAGLDVVGKLADDYQAGSPGAEFLGFGILMLTVAATTENKVSKSGSGIAVGGALLAGLLLSNGILNPAVAIAMGEAASPATWMTAVSGAVFALLFSLFERARPPKTDKTAD